MTNDGESDPARSTRRRWGWVLVFAVAAVGVLVLGAGWWVQSRPDSRTVHFPFTYSESSDGNQLRLSYTHGTCDHDQRVEVLEQAPDRVIVAITRQRDVGGICNSMAWFGHATVILASPLDSRPVYYDTGAGYRPASTRTDALARVTN